MLSVSDILKILDQIPIWKTVKELPKRVEALEAANAELQSRLDALTAAPKKAPGETCKACGEPAVRRKSSTPSATMGDMGMRDEVWVCDDCGDTETRFAMR